MKFYPMVLVVMLMALFSACIAPVQPVSTAETASDQAMAAHGDHEHMTDPSAQLGEVDFPVLCTPEAQEEFNHGMALLHSFEFGFAIESFNHVTDLDSDCSMAHWGEPTVQMLAYGWAAVEKAMAIGVKTPRE